MFCKICGSQIKEDAKFCPGCGRQLEIRPATVVPEVSNVYYPEPQESESQKPIKKRMHKVLLVFFCIFITLFGLLASIGLTVRNLTNEEGITELVDEIDIADINIRFVTHRRNKDTLPELIYESIPQNISSGFSERDIDDLLNSSFVQEFIADNLNEYVEDVFKNNGEGVVTVREVERFIERNVEDIFYELNIDYEYGTYENYEIVTDYLVDGAREMDIERYTDLGNSGIKNNTVFSVVSVVLSYPVLIVVALVFFLLLVLVFIRNTLHSSGISLGICTLIISLVNLISVLVIRILEGNLADSFILGEETLETLVEFCSEALLGTGLISLGVAAFMFVLGFIGKIYIKKKR